MKEPQDQSESRPSETSRRLFLRAVGGLGFLVIGAESALGRSLQLGQGESLALNDDTGDMVCTTYSHTETQTLSGVKPSSTWAFTNTGNSTTGGTKTKTGIINQTFTRTRSFIEDGQDYAITEFVSHVFSPVQTVVYTFSYGPDGYSVTGRVASKYTVYQTLTQTLTWNVTCEWGEEPPVSDESGNGDFSLQSGRRSSGGGIPKIDMGKNILDARSRFGDTLQVSFG